jgi:hypothetical protein
MASQLVFVAEPWKYMPLAGEATAEDVPVVSTKPIRIFVLVARLSACFCSQTSKTGLEEAAVKTACEVIAAPTLAAAVPAPAAAPP